MEHLNKVLTELKLETQVRSLLVRVHTVPSGPCTHSTYWSVYTQYLFTDHWAFALLLTHATRILTMVQVNLVSI